VVVVLEGRGAFFALPRVCVHCCCLMAWLPARAGHLEDIELEAWSCCSTVVVFRSCSDVGLSRVGPGRNTNNCVLAMHGWMESTLTWAGFAAMRLVRLCLLCVWANVCCVCACVCVLDQVDRYVLSLCTIRMYFCCFLHNASLPCVIHMPRHGRTVAASCAFVV
jgi:hypothetical protein